VTKQKQTKEQQCLMQVSEVARRTGYSTKRVDQLVRAGVVSPLKVAGLRFYSDTDVQALMGHRARAQAKRNRTAGPEQD
jgi:DNA-binding transcriptional MerR regulator